MLDPQMVPPQVLPQLGLQRSSFNNTSRDYSTQQQRSVLSGWNSHNSASSCPSAHYTNTTNNTNDKNNNRSTDSSAHPIPCLIVGDVSREKENFCALAKLHSQDFLVHGHKLQFISIDYPNQLTEFFCNDKKNDNNNNPTTTTTTTTEQESERDDDDFLVIVFCYSTEKEKKHLCRKWSTLVKSNCPLESLLNRHKVVLYCMEFERMYHNHYHHLHWTSGTSTTRRCPSPLPGRSLDSFELLTLCDRAGAVHLGVCDTTCEDACMEALKEMCETVSDRHWQFIKEANQNTPLEQRGFSSPGASRHLLPPSL